MAEVVRGTLAGDVFPLRPQPFFVLLAWCVAGFAATRAAMTRRG